MSLSISSISIGNGGRGLPALAGPTEVDQYDLRKRTGCGLRAADAKRKSRHDRGHREGFPAWDPNGRVGQGKLDRAGCAKSSSDDVAVLFPASGQAEEGSRRGAKNPHTSAGA